MNLLQSDYEQGKRYEKTAFYAVFDPKKQEKAKKSKKFEKRG